MPLAVTLVVGVIVAVAVALIAVEAVTVAVPLAMLVVVAGLGAINPRSLIPSADHRDGPRCYAPAPLFPTLSGSNDTMPSRVSAIASARHAACMHDTIQLNCG